VPLAGHRQRIENGGRFSRLFIAKKQPGLLAHDGAFDRGLGSIVIYGDPAVFEKSLKGFPAVADETLTDNLCLHAGTRRHRCKKPKKYAWSLISESWYGVFYDNRRWRSDKVPMFCSDKVTFPSTVPLPSRELFMRMNSPLSLDVQR
jgi:hypothetical protein